MPNNYVLLERIELNQSAASVTFNNLNTLTGYTDLKLVSSIRAFDNNEWITLTINGATTNVSGRYLYGNGASASSGTVAAGGLLNPMVPSSWTANTFSNNEFYITNYASTTTVKSISVDGVAEYNNASADTMMSGILWNSTAAITSVGVQATAGSFAQYSTFSLYGIANANTTPAIAPKADGGNVIATDGTYWYHAFLTNGTFTPQVGLSADVLVVAGGGGGGYAAGGGGGAGGLRALASQALSATNYTVTVGSGGAGGTSPTSGINSTFASISATGGGRGAGPSAPATGGSGGGGYNASTAGAAGNAGSYSPVEGYAGGTGQVGTSTNAYSAGGGGGAGAAGANGTNTVSGNGGAGVNTYSSWASATGTGVSGYYAGGGGGGNDSFRGSSGGSGGAGGGGAGGTSAGQAGTAGTVNTGGGGGGSANGGSGLPAGAGGSGIVIVRYLVA